MLVRLVLAGALSLSGCANTEPPAADSSPNKTQPEPSTPPARDTIPDDSPTLAEHDLIKAIHVGGANFSGELFVVREDASFVAVEVIGAYIGNPNDPSDAPEPRVRRGRISDEELDGLRSLLADAELATMPEDVRDLSGSAHPSQVELIMRTPSGIIRTQYTPHKRVPESLRLLRDLIGYIERRYLPPLPERGTPVDDW